MTQLTGLHILITRPEEAGKELANKLTELGADTFQEPMFLIEPISSQAYTKLLINVKPHLIIATSVFAVKTAGAYLHKHHKVWQTKIPAIGIGPATAGALHARVATSHLPKIFNSEGILDLRITTRIRGETVLILTGAHGRNLLTSELTARGAKVIQIDGYERRPQQHLSPTTLELLAKQPALVVLTSVEAWQTLEQLMLSVAPSLLAQSTLVVASKRIAETIWKKHRQQSIVIANDASNEAMIATISRIKENVV